MHLRAEALFSQDGSLIVGHVNVLVLVPPNPNHVVMRNPEMLQLTRWFSVRCSPGVGREED